MSRALTPEQWRKVSEVFEQAIGNPEILTEVSDPLIRSEVESLLGAHEGAGTFLDEPISPQFLYDVVNGYQAFSPGDTTGDFRILKILGAGSFATVYLARQISLERNVAVKISANFGEEARNMAPLEHDNIVKVFFETVDGVKNTRQLCMQYVPGASLDYVLKEIEKRGGDRSGKTLLEILDGLDTGETMFNPTALQDRDRLSKLDYPQACLWIGWQIADALAYAHERQVLHLDVKPGNILLSPYGRPLLTDFNIASRRDGAERSTPFGGTLDYMAPEQKAIFQSGSREAIAAIDGRADLYSLAVVLKQMLEKGGEKLNVETPRTQIERVLCRCLAENPGDRYASASALADALRSCLELRELAAKLPAPGKLVRLTERRWLPVLVFFILTPQVLGSIVNILYNAMRIVSELTVAQQDAFHRMCVYYNMVSYPLCTLLIYRLSRPLAKCFAPPAELCDMADDDLAWLRKRVLHFPEWLVAVCVLGWMPGSILFPWYIDWAAGPVASEVYGHFFISFTLSCLVAMTYSFLYVHFVMLRAFYPRLWLCVKNIPLRAREELRGTESRLRVFHMMAGVVPLAGAALIVLVGPEGAHATHYRTYQFLIFLMLGMGMAGIAFALRSAGLIGQTISALTGTTKE